MSTAPSPTAPPDVSHDALSPPPDTGQRGFGLSVALLPLCGAVFVSIFVYFNPPSPTVSAGEAYVLGAWTFPAVLSSYLTRTLVFFPGLFAVAFGCLLRRFPRSEVCMFLAKVGFVLSCISAFLGLLFLYFDPPGVFHAP